MHHDWNDPHVKAAVPHISQGLCHFGGRLEPDIVAGVVSAGRFGELTMQGCGTADGDTLSGRFNQIWSVSLKHHVGSPNYVTGCQIK